MQDNLLNLHSRSLQHHQTLTLDVLSFWTLVYIYMYSQHELINSCKSLEPKNYNTHFKIYHLKFWFPEYLVKRWWKNESLLLFWRFDNGVGSKGQHTGSQIRDATIFQKLISATTTASAHSWHIYSFTCVDSFVFAWI